MVVQETSFDIRDKVTQNFKIQEAIWSSPLPLNRLAHSFFPFCGFISNKLFVSDSDALLPDD